MDTLKNLLKHKNPKVAANAILALAALVSNYGIRSVIIGEYADIILKNAQSTNQDCKKASYEYYRACYKWIGDDLLPEIEGKLKKS